MRGHILGYSTETGEGLVSGDDGRRYRFTREAWPAPGSAVAGQHVDFEPQADEAVNIYPIPTAAVPVTPVRRKSRTTAALLAFFLGGLGIHKFYLGQTGMGILYLVLTISIIGILFTGPASLVDFIRYLVMSDDEFYQRYEQGH